ncbi:MAG: aspartate ammonia-lyase [Saprospiraceae bacterium]|nr:MAG: aspartate ammonia-lyase [Saprospiraceae bacterium]
MPRVSNTQTGVAGEYYVAAELTRRGIFAAITLRNSEAYDILALNPLTNKQFGIQVKTTWEKRRWALNKKVEDVYSENHFYIFVVLFQNDSRKPEFFIIHSKELAEIICQEHRNWLATPGKKGQPHNDNDMRNFDDREGDYLDRWDNFLK